MANAVTPLDVDKLLGYNIPSVRQNLAPSDAAFYALSVGLGQDPLDERQLRFVDPARNLLTLPTFAVVLGYPGFWLGDPATGVDPRSVLHGEQGVEIRRMLPTSGAITGTTRITGLTDKGPGRGALLYTERSIVDDATGDVLATTITTTFLRGYGGFSTTLGSPRDIHSMPETPPDITVDLPTRPEQALYYRLNGDLSPLHADPRVAAASGFARPILHGLCTLGVIGHALLRALVEYEPSRLRALHLRFSSPVYPGETIRTEIWRDGSFQARVVEREGLVASNGLATFS